MAAPGFGPYPHRQIGSPGRDKGLLNRPGGRDAVGDQELKQNSRFLRVEIEPDGKTERIVVDLDVAVDETGSDPRRADDKDATFGSVGEHRNRLLGGVAVADAGKDKALGTTLDRILDRSTVHVGVRIDDVDP